MIDDRRARVVPFRPKDPRLEFHCRRMAAKGRELQAAQDRLADAQRRRDELLDVAADVQTRVEAMTPAERQRRAEELGLLVGLYREGFPPFDGPEIA